MSIVASAPSALTRDAGFVTLFPGLSSAAQRTLAEVSEVRRVAAGSWLYGSGDPPAGLFAVLDGVAMVYVALARGDDVLVHAALPGEVFGQAAKLGHGPRLATVLAARPSMFLHVPEAGLAEATRQHPEVWQALAGLLYAQLGGTLTLLSEALALTVRARLASRLLQLSRRDGVVPLTQNHLAELTGSTRKTTSAVLQQFATAGGVELRYRRIIVRDRAHLEEASRS